MENQESEDGKNIINIRCIYNDKAFEIKIPSTENLLNLKHYIIINLNGVGIYTYETNLNIAYGFPPKKIDNTLNDTKTLPELSIGNNECLRIDLIDKDLIRAKNDEIIDYSKYSVKKKTIPADNSCLFNSINFAINQSITEPEIIRGIISSEILNNPIDYNEAILERPIEDYCDWILRGDSWGGGIEISILSKYFNVIIAVVDIQNITFEYFGDGFTEIIYLLYNNVHYDVFYKEDINGKITGLFDVNDEKSKNEIMEICKELKKHQKYLDIQIFSVKCMQCNFLMKGQNDVIEHTKKTGHTNFSQI
jgi:ubiquitin thioesterase OTU1